MGDIDRGRGEGGCYLMEEARIRPRVSLGTISLEMRRGNCTCPGITVKYDKGGRGREEERGRYCNNNNNVSWGMWRAMGEIDKIKSSINDDQ